MNKISSLLNLFRVGYSLANAASWKTTAINANIIALATAGLAVLNAYGIMIPFITPDIISLLTTTGLATTGSVMALYNIVTHVITSDKVGILPSKAPAIGQAISTSTDKAQNIL